MSEHVNGRRVRRSKSDWLTLIEAQRESGLSQQRFCEQRQISVGAFYHAKSRYEARTDERSAAAHEAFVPLGITSASAPSSSGWEIELSLGGEVVLRLRRP